MSDDTERDTRVAAIKEWHAVLDAAAAEMERGISDARARHDRVVAEATAKCNRILNDNETDGIRISVRRGDEATA